MTNEEYQQAAERLRTRLMEQARHYLADGAEAEDAVQDALLRLWQLHERLQLPVDALAVVLTRNICIDMLRRKMHRETLEESWEQDRDAGSNQTTSLHDSADHERIERLMTVVDTLPDFQQTLLRLRHIEGMEMGELARLLQMKEPAVRKALSRARMAVRDRYLKQKDDE